MTVAIYAGSFDPITLGHEDVIQRAAHVFDRVIVAVGVNSSKRYIFDKDERVTLALTALDRISRKEVEVAPFEGLLVDFCKAQRASVMIRGLRALTDFDYELGIAHVNWTQAPEIETMFFVTKPAYSFVSSSMVKEIARGGGDLSKFVADDVAQALRAKFPRP